MRAPIALLLALPLVACTESHGRVPNVDGDAPIISLTIDDWAHFCIWREGLRAGQPLTYECDDEGNPLLEECPRTDCHNWERGVCLDGIRSLDGFFPSSRVTCTASVEQYAACWESLAAVPCYVLMTTATPECIAFWEACPPRVPTDAGTGSD